MPPVHCRDRGLLENAIRDAKTTTLCPMSRFLCKVVYKTPLFPLTTTLPVLDRLTANCAVLQGYSSANKINGHEWNINNSCNRGLEANSKGPDVSWLSENPSRKVSNPGLCANIVETAIQHLDTLRTSFRRKLFKENKGRKFVNYEHSSKKAPREAKLFFEMPKPSMSRDLSRSLSRHGAGVESYAGTLGCSWPPCGHTRGQGPMERMKIAPQVVLLLLGVERDE